MARSFSVNDNNDIYLDKNGNLAISTDLQAISEVCEQKVKTVLGEIIFNTTVGIPYFETAWIGTPKILQFQAAVRNAVLSVEGVIQINNFIISQIQNTLTYSIEINTIYGTGVING